MIKKLIIVSSVIIAAVFSGLYLVGNMKVQIPSDDSQTSYSETAPPLVSVMVRPVLLSENDRVFEAVGTGRARRSVDIYPAVAEQVSDVLFQAQQYVSKGDVLVQLDDREEKLAIRLARVKLRDAKSLLNRYEQAVKEGAVPQSEVDSARADLNSAEVSLDQAKLAFEERKIRAPFAGIVGIPKVDPGDRVGTDTLITGLDDRGVIFVDFDLPESLSGSIGEDTTVAATTPAYPGRQFTGHISAEESRVDPQSRTIMVRANIDNGEDILRPGMSFKTRLSIPGDKYPTVPEIALQWDQTDSYIWIIRDERALKVDAKVIARTAGKVLLEGQISEGEPVVIEGLQRLRQGRKVRILDKGVLKTGKQADTN